MRSTGQPWQAGPYGTRARDLLARHAANLRALLAAFDELAGRARAKGGRMVITHGGPDAGNAPKTPAGFALVSVPAPPSGTPVRPRGADRASARRLDALDRLVRQSLASASGLR